MRYRRARVAGATYFFTVNLADRSRNLLIEYIDVLRSSLRKVKTRHPFQVDAMVILPDHLHALWTLPAHDNDYPTRWMLIKSNFSRQLPPLGSRNPGRAGRGEREIWQRRYWEHCIRDDRDFRQHADYIHYNPVKHGHARSPADWPYSTFHREVQRGTYSADWGASVDPGIITLDHDV